MTDGSGPRRHADAGGVGLLTVLAGLLLTGVCLALIMVAAEVGVAAARARTAADAAALAAAGASPLAGGDGDSRGAASRLAVANGARLVSCCAARMVGEGPGAGNPLVVVEVEVTLGRAGFGMDGRAVRARAGARLRPADAPVPGVR